MPTRLSLLLALLLLSGLLLASGFAHAASTPPTSDAPILESLSEDEGEEGEGEDEESECETAEEELEEGELEPADVEAICTEEKAREKKKKASGTDNSAPIAPEECVLRSAHGHASLFSHDDKLKLTIGYTTYEPVTAKLKIGRIATLHRHLGRSGVLRLVEGLPSNRTPKQLTVRIELPGKSAGCPFRRLVLFPR